MIMTSRHIDSIENFKRGGMFPYSVKYLGRGPDNGEIPDFVLERRSPVSGKLTFSLDKVSFFCEEDVYNDLFGDFTHNSSLKFAEESANFIYQMHQIECEKLCKKENLVVMALVPGVSTYDRRKIYFDFADPKNEGRTVYHPQWVEIAKHHNEGQSEQ